ncbi:MAG: alpha/beta hydrolase [Nitrospira sp.]|nr:MAG: alpha/beta hydrolase [Nitrospira sp.]
MLTKRRHRFRPLRKLLHVAIGLLLFALIGVGYQIVGMVQDRKQYPPPGQLIDVGGYKLHLYCTGEGSPTVILDAMGPGWSIYWAQVQPEIAKVTRVCSYDRAGVGWSDTGRLPRIGRRMADELHQLLTNGGISGPYVLVGHSLGGFVARLYRQAHPNDVVGMVLVDAGHERQFDQVEFMRFVLPGKSMFPIIRAMTALGLTRLLLVQDRAPTIITAQEAGVSAEMRPFLRMGWLQSRYFKTMTDEGAALEGTAGQTGMTGSLGDLPLIVLTATGPTWWPEMPSTVNPANFRKMWLKLQTDLTKLSTNSRQVFADRSSHFINFDQPELIIEAIQEMLAAQTPPQPRG